MRFQEKVSDKQTLNGCLFLLILFSLSQRLRVAGIQNCECTELGTESPCVGPGTTEAPAACTGPARREGVGRVPPDELGVFNGTNKTQSLTYLRTYLLCAVFFIRKTTADVTQGVTGEPVPLGFLSAFLGRWGSIVIELL